MLDKENISRPNDRSSQIRDELASLYTEQSDFYRDGTRTKHTQTELAECENRRQLIRRLFQELDELRKTAEWHYTGGNAR
jgi:hypothetical protein